MAASFGDTFPDVTAEEMQRRFGDPRFTAAMEYMQRPETEIFPRS